MSNLSHIPLLREGVLGSPPLLRYVESKSVDHAKINDLLEHCARENMWANFGPLSRMLDKRLTDLLEVPAHLQVISCSNATVALHALVALHEHLRGRPLRWLTSAFGFYSSSNGVLSSAGIVDCDRDGMLDLDQLNPDTFDGFIVTNMFGRYSDLACYQSYAAQHGKLLLVDGAMAFHPGGHCANECISLHHTKPWGFGEGGCAIVDREHADLFRSLIAFGHPTPSAPINRLGINGKISEVSCAYILMRLEGVSEIRNAYQLQYQRIVAIGEGLGLAVLGGTGVHPGVPSNVPFLFPAAVDLPASTPVPARKYYHPLARTMRALEIYSRIINVPCHRELALLSDQAIEGYLAGLLQQAGEPSA